MLKKILFSANIMLFFPVFAFAQFFDLPPDNIRQIVSDENWKEVYCLETKAQGGWAVSRIQGFAEAIKKPLKDFQDVLSLYDTDSWYEFQNSPILDFYGSFSDYDSLRWSEEDTPTNIPDLNYYDGLAKTIKLDLSEICAAETLSQELELINKFVLAFADEPALSMYIEDYFSEEIKLFADRLEKAVQENIDAIIEQNKSSYDSLRSETEKKLRYQADQEISQREIEAEKQIKNEVEWEIQQRAMSGEFGVPPDLNQSAIEAATNVLVSQKKLEAAQRIEAELIEKYNRLARQEEEKLENEMMARVEELSWQKFNKLREEFADIKDKALSNADKIYNEEWLRFYNKAYDKKIEIITAILDVQTAQAKKWIINHRDEIEKSREAVVKEGLDFPTVDQILNQLETEKQNLILELSGNPSAFRDVNAAAASLRTLWNKARLLAENVENRISYQLLSQALSFINNSRFMNRLNYEAKILDYWSSSFDVLFEEKKAECRKIGYDVNFNKRNIPSLWSTDYYLYQMNFPDRPDMKMADYFKKYFDDRALRQIPNLDEAEEKVQHYVDMPWFCQAFLNSESDINVFGKDLESARRANKGLLNVLQEFSNYNSQTSAEKLTAYKDKLIKARNAYSAVDGAFDRYKSYFFYPRRDWRENGATLEKLSLLQARPEKYEGANGWLANKSSSCRTFENRINKTSYRETLCFPQYQEK